jgi:hypothetical protein
LFDFLFLQNLFYQTSFWAEFFFYPRGHRPQTEIFEKSFMIKNRKTEKNFTRKRKITFPELIMIQINMLKKSLQKELVHFYTIISKPITVMKSAFSQSRMKLKPEAFIDINDTLVKGFY